MLLSAGQLLNIAPVSVFQPLGSFTVVSAVHLLKRLFSTSTTDSGIVIWVNAFISQKAASPMDVTVLAIETDVTFGRQQNALSPMRVIPELTTTFLTLEA